MAKVFTPRVTKKERTTIDLTENFDFDRFRFADERLLRGAKLDEIKLDDVVVKDQVRTKFNDASIKELADNIKQNGLIQPLVLHRIGEKYTLICGERRFRAMRLIDMKVAPCFVLEGKTMQELMAIQFSENSSREALHYIDRADGILNYQKTTKASERQIQSALGISKSEVHRSLMIAKLPDEIKDAAKVYDIEKYVLIEYDALTAESLKKEVRARIISGEISTRAKLRKVIKASATGDTSSTRPQKTTALKVSSKRTTLSQTVSANAFIKALNNKSQDMDAKTRALLRTLVEETKEIIDL